jgi:D-alanyl-D-alanine carboxypeptidase (penicillin-binding protein 5/6)
VDGIKTGYTETAGPTFVASVERDGHRIIVVLLNAPSMAFDAIALIEWAYAGFVWP